jgi:hypothetical protein
MEAPMNTRPGLRCWLTAAIVVLLLFSGPTRAFNTYRVGTAIIGQEHVDILKRWVDRDFSLWVGAEGKESYLIFEADTGLGEAHVLLTYTPQVRDKLSKAVAKAIEWSQVAASNHADVTKGLGCFTSHTSQLASCADGAFDKDQMSLSFFAAGGGRQTSLIITVIDRDNEFRKADLYLDIPQMKALLQVIDGIEPVLQQAKATAAKADLFH